jgi:hypothetical protein
MPLSLDIITNIIYDMLKTLERKFQDIAGTFSMPKSDKNNYSFSVQKKHSSVTSCSHNLIYYIPQVHIYNKYNERVKPTVCKLITPMIFVN